MRLTATEENLLRRRCQKAMLAIWGLARLTALLILPISAGCGKPQGEPVYPVSGSVFFKGQPAAGVRVIFHPTGQTPGGNVVRPSAETLEDGSFRLTSVEPGDGAAKGQYNVSLTWLATGNAGGTGIMGGGEARAGGPDRLGNRYSDPGNSGLSFSVSEGENVVPRFDLK